MSRQGIWKLLAFFVVVLLVGLSVLWMREEKEMGILRSILRNGAANNNWFNGKLAREKLHLKKASTIKPTPLKTFYNLADDIDYSREAAPRLSADGAISDKIELDYFRYLQNLQFDCRHRIRAGTGETGDGGWEMCLDPPYNMKPGKCLVYSFGISTNWSFDDYMDKTRNCTVHCFDPSIGKKDFKRSPNIYFHNLGISGRNETNGKKWQLYTLGSIKRLLGHENVTLDYLKMDVEWSEWPSLQAMYREGVLSQVKQFASEFHGIPKKQADVDIINRLYELGFRIFYTKRNFYNRATSRLTQRTIYRCMEVHFVNINFLKQDV
ncbi:methyltransferase-like protein 24 isoform X1 [Lingula anatina]|uniref:Methyltransferase-like protein 24 isoform X1 n=2 Tax=Lingula anatina TaxID=7574 RepID=A0A1S3KEQ4_LINAN|nr:methyltransferase-like protein 24 isoform X1 [Lingula anatina]XP_013420982.1 methyltransferase-like protein 24 isoform X1 [Lingula anatina]|eukprot:XP_013420981.1 methyltransferase-like protein 24 isoform X1 [Lingula anatina]